MTAEVVNLNRARKAKAREERAVEASANRIRFGRTKAVRDAETAEGARRDHVLDGAKRGD